MPLKLDPVTREALEARLGAVKLAMTVHANVLDQLARDLEIGITPSKVFGDLPAATRARANREVNRANDLRAEALKLHTALGSPDTEIQKLLAIDLAFKAATTGWTPPKENPDDQ